MSPGRISIPAWESGAELDSVRNPMDRRPLFILMVLICGNDAWIRCIQSPFMPICVMSVWKRPLAVGNNSTSADEIAARHIHGSSKLKTLLHCTFDLPRITPRATATISERVRRHLDFSSDVCIPRTAEYTRCVGHRFRSTGYK